MVDFITKLLLVAGKNIILVVCGWLSNIVYFIAELMRKLNKMLGIKTRLSTVFHPQIDG